jgi:hypothetical protein
LVIDDLINKTIAEQHAKIEMLERHLAGYRPIPVSERMPEEDVPVLAFDGEWWTAVRIEGRWEDIGSIGLQDVSVSHWMPLPPAPE